jgi:SAM-dependent methyltransferase
MTDYVREYFDSRASAWLEQAYLKDPLPAKYRIGDERVRVTIEGVAGAVPPRGSLVDLGCGGGQLCLHAARLGWKVIGIDIAEGMVEEARRLCAGTDVELLVAAFDDNELPEEAFDAVSALGLIEYLADDEGLLREASRLLRSGGRFAVSCRNRLYNVSSLNDYTLAEADRGAVGELAAELATTLRGTDRATMSRLAASLAEAAPELEEAMRLDESTPPPDLLDHPTAFVQERRQHTPAGIAGAAEGAGLRLVGIKALHPHPLPAAIEPVAPRFYNRLALAFQRPLEDSPLGLATASSYVALFEKV